MANDQWLKARFYAGFTVWRVGWRRLLSGDFDTILSPRRTSDPNSPCSPSGLPFSGYRNTSIGITVTSPTCGRKSR